MPGEIPESNEIESEPQRRHKEVTMKKRQLQVGFIASLTVAVSVFITAGGAQSQFDYARSNNSLS